MTYGGAGTQARWPVASDQRARRYGPRADITASVLLLVAGFCGLLQYAVPAFPIGQSQPVGGSVLTGKQLLATLSVYTRDASSTADVTRIAILVAAVGGGALVLLGLATLLPVNHRPFGGVGLILTLCMVAGALWTLAQAEQVLGSPMSALLSIEQPGWYLMTAAALVGLTGSIRALGG